MMPKLVGTQGCVSHLDFSAGTITQDSFQISTDKQQRLTTPREFQRVMAGFLRDPPSGHTRACRVRYILERGLRHHTLLRDGGKLCPVLQWDVSEVGSWTLLKWSDCGLAYLREHVQAITPITHVWDLIWK